MEEIPEKCVDCEDRNECHKIADLVHSFAVFIVGMKGVHDPIKCIEYTKAVGGKPEDAYDSLVKVVGVFVVKLGENQNLSSSEGKQLIDEFLDDYMDKRIAAH